MNQFRLQEFSPFYRKLKDMKNPCSSQLTKLIPYDALIANYKFDGKSTNLCLHVLISEITH